ncbi:unnamed protein product [Macrosiphum euphorbiae]|uniref:Uncharacterized protein n=1 Tax=Macrosiphum euphorbiae TaxID=13131 RepID=A0AAV0WR36_9HEMI|nr:unnamed protein product [Macrosiphum euphorbiae]
MIKNSKANLPEGNDVSPSYGREVRGFSLRYVYSLLQVLLHRTHCNSSCYCSTQSSKAFSACRPDEDNSTVLPQCFLRHPTGSSIYSHRHH